MYLPFSASHQRSSTAREASREGSVPLGKYCLSYCDLEVPKVAMYLGADIIIARLVDVYKDPNP